ncbi:MAG: hypothetical protein CMF48_04370 [Legionellales bacterium]|nr:hypothetical protein [Legionellales bacterium]|tara:strand:- start:1715 stop:2830 length:1116 start_codon:yes stop_codon:yes gene_type:complete
MFPREKLEGLTSSRDQEEAFHYTGNSTPEVMMSPAEERVLALRQEAQSDRELELARRYESLRKAFVQRRSQSQRCLMTSVDAHAVLHPGDKFILSELARVKEERPVGLMAEDDSASYSNPSSTIMALWRSDIVARQSSEANVFGSSGSLCVSSEHQHIDIAVQDARDYNPDFLASFGAHIYPIDEETTLPPNGHFDNLYLVEYEFGQEYIDKYVFNESKGGGLFVETHDFPHVFMPMSPKCSGGLILGKKRKDLSDEAIEFIGVDIPFGYALFLDANAIHGDSFFKGNYSIALTEELPADTVIFKHVRDSEEMRCLKANKLLTGELKFQPLKQHRVNRHWDAVENSRIKKIKKKSEKLSVGILSVGKRRAP